MKLQLKTEDDFYILTLLNGQYINEALTIIARIKDIIYSIDSFEKDLTKIKIFNLDSFKINTIEIKTLYDEILYFNEKFYGLIRENRNKHLYNITKNEKLFTTSEEVAYIDEDVIITFIGYIRILKKMIGITIQQNTMIKYNYI